MIRTTPPDPALAELPTAELLAEIDRERAAVHSSGRDAASTVRLRLLLRTLRLRHQTRRQKEDHAARLRARHLNALAMMVAEP